MYSLLIVEDDEIIKEGLIKNINWSEQNIKIVGTADNGIEAYEFVKLNRPQIVLSDIRMPFMDGIKLAEKIKSSFPETKIIFLTGYDDFRYAKEAVNLKIEKYLLKYADNKEILEAVVNATADLKKENISRSTLKEAQTILVNEYFKDLVKGLISDEFILSEAEKLEIKFNGTLFCTVIINFDTTCLLSSASNISCISLKKITSCINETCAEMVITCDNGNVFINSDNEIGILFNFNEQNTNKQDVCNFMARFTDEIYQLLKQITEVDFTIGVSNVLYDYRNIAKTYSEAIMAIESKGILNLSEIIYFNDLKNYGSSSHGTLMKNITKFIEKNYYKESLSLDDIANEVFISSSYISTLFKKYKGLNFSEYLIKLRIEKSIELLINTDMKVYEISNSIGYSNSQYFSVLFKNYTGFTPSQFRTKNKDNTCKC